MTTDVRHMSGMLGLARRAGKLIIGTDQVCTAMAKTGEGRVRLVLISYTASDLTKKKVTVKCAFYDIPVREIMIDTQELGRLLGKTTTPAVVAVTDEHFAQKITSCAQGSVTIATKG